MSDVTAAVNSSLNSVSGTLDLVANAARNGAADARVAATKALSNTSLFLSRVVYQTTYAISYGVVFPAAFVARAIPRNNAAVRGLIEGAHAASQRATRFWAARWKHRLHTEDPVAGGCRSIIPSGCNTVVADDRDAASHALGKRPGDRDAVAPDLRGLQEPCCLGATQ